MHQSSCVGRSSRQEKSAQNILLENVQEDLHVRFEYHKIKCYPAASLQIIARLDWPGLAAMFAAVTIVIVVVVILFVVVVRNSNRQVRVNTNSFTLAAMTCRPVCIPLFTDM